MEEKFFNKTNKGVFTSLPHEIIVLYFVFLLSLYALSIFFVFHISHTADTIYGNLVSKQMYEYKKDILKTTVENAIRSFEEIRKNVENQLDEEQAFFLEKISELVTYYGKDEAGIVLRLPNILAQGHLFVKIANDKTNKIIYSTYPNSLVGGEIYYKKTAKIDDYFIEIAYAHSFLYNKIVSIVTAYVHAQKFTNDSYIWINEVHNWEGGDNYAIRLVHPNLPEIEGMFLSTNMQDIKGNLPYLEELEGLRKKGSLFSSYYFKRKNSEEIAEKLTFASLYPDFNWIVAMGIHVDDIEAQVNYISQESKVFAKVQIIKTILSLTIWFIIVLFLLIIMSSIYINRTKRRIAKESNLDFLTNIYNRKIADEHLLLSFYEYKKTGHNQFVFLFDIDDFKNINDSYGHTAGDTVLKRIVGILQAEIRGTDSLFRWGGEEFVLVCKDVEIEEIASFAQRLIEAVRNTAIIITHPKRKKIKFLQQRKKDSEDYTIDLGNNDYSSETTRSLSVTISAGVSCFSPQDANYYECFKRVDLALYESKNTGKNKYTILY